MTEYEIRAGLDRLEQHFSRGKPYNRSETEEIMDVVMRWTSAKFDAVIAGFIHNSRSLPRRPADWVQASRRQRDEAGPDSRTMGHLHAGNWHKLKEKEADPDPDRAKRIGRMMGSPDAKQRAYARYLVAHMRADDRDKAMDGYHEVDPSVRRYLAHLDDSAVGRMAEADVKAERDRVADARRMMVAAEDAPPFKPPCSLNQFIAAWRAKRGPDFKSGPVDPQEAERVAAEVRREMFDLAASREEG